jgi:predicted NUDIX family NTP pyrophosphohydrolase
MESAGILLFKRMENELYFFLVHPGGPFFRKKDKGWWSIPKGLPDEGEQMEEAALREFGEETGFIPQGPLLPLGHIKQKGGKTVHAWAIEGNFPVDWQLKSNSFQMEWPPHSGKIQNFPEADEGRFFSEPDALEYILPPQAEFIKRLKTMI